MDDQASGPDFRNSQYGVESPRPAYTSIAPKVYICFVGLTESMAGSAEQFVEADDSSGFASLVGVCGEIECCMGSSDSPHPLNELAKFGAVVDAVGDSVSCSAVFNVSHRRFVRSGARGFLRRLFGVSRFSLVIGRREVRVRENQNWKTEEGFRLNCCKPRAVSAPTPCRAGDAICTTMEGACDRRRSDFDNGVQLRFHPSHRRTAELSRNACQFDTGAVFGLPYPVSEARSVLTPNAQRSARPRPWLINDEHPELWGKVAWGCMV